MTVKRLLPLRNLVITRYYLRKFGNLITLFCRSNNPRLPGHKDRINDRATGHSLRNSRTSCSVLFVSV